jgi:hypothetical protein
MKQAIKKVALALACAGGMAATMQVEAANWLMLQGTERSSAAGRAKLWGFLQPTYSSTAGSTVPAGPWAGQPMQPNMLAPHLATNKSFGIRRARIGVRGQGFPLDPKVNYFFLAEFGSNGISWPNGGDGGAMIDHASVTLNHIPGARIRTGLFKVPMSEEMLQAIHVFDYINFTNFADQQLLERFFDSDGSGTFVKGVPGDRPVAGPPGPTNQIPAQTDNYDNPLNGPVAAVRDQGIQVFDSFKTGGWETSYAFMVGNGNGINRSDNNTHLEKYVYFSTEKVFAGKGPRVQSLKLFAWSQNGNRDLATYDYSCTNIFDSGTCAYKTDGTFERKRSGVGFTYRKGNIRAAGEILRAEGMIFGGSDGGAVVGTTGSVPAAGAPLGDGDGDLTDPANTLAIVSSFNVQENEKADAYYVHFGYAVNRNLELDIRYDRMNRGTVVALNERTFETTTLGAQWFFNLKNRLTVNYEIRSLKSPNEASSKTANLVGAAIDNRLSVQITSIF